MCAEGKREERSFLKQEMPFMSHKIQHLVLAQFAGHGVFLLNGTYPPEALNYMVEYKTMHTVLCWLWQLCIQVGGAIVSVCF